MQSELHQAPPNETDIINQPELLQRVPISRRTAFAWEQKGILPVIKIGRRKLYHWKNVEAALLRQQKGGVE